MRQITLNRQLLGLEDLLFGTGTVTQNRANQVVTITEINAGNLPFDKTRTLVKFAQDTNLEELGNSVKAINNINNNLDKLLIIEDNLPIINNVKAIKESIVTLDTNILALQNIYTNMSSINTVEDNLPKVVSVAQNIVPNLTEILNVDTLAAQVTQDKSDVSSMKLVVETIYDTFDDRFLGTKIVDPTLDNDGNALINGAMYFNTSSNTMKVYDVGTTTWYSIPQVYLSALLDVQLTSITSGNVLRWNGTKWINYTLSKSDVGLNLVDNTADSAKNVLSSTKLTTARTINGVSFDGMANITISDSTAVKLTGNQTIEDVKTFTSSPIVPTPTTDFQSVPLKSTNITVNVGAGQTYTTINQALEYLSGFYPRYKKSGVTATINLKAGFVMAEQVLVSGIDLGWITIVGEDTETIITHTALTTNFNDTEYPAFGVDKGGTSPVIGQLFRFNVEKVGGYKHGLMTFGAGSSAYVLPSKGFIGAGTNGIFANNGSIINAVSANCSNAGTNGIFAQNASIINAVSANCSNAGTNGIFANNGSAINAVIAVIQNQTTGTSRVRVQGGSSIVAGGINITGGTAPVFNQAANTLASNGIIYQ